MVIGTNDLDEIDVFGEENNDFYENEPVNTETNLEETPVDPGNHSYETDLLTRILNSKGITDLDKIKFEGDNGEIEEIKWNDLTVDEQFNIINYREEPEEGLDDDEIDLINEIRNAKLTPREFKDYLIRQGAAYTNQPVEETYSIDSMSDDDLYMWDLQSRNEDITDEEALDALDKAKMSTASFAKQIKGIRDEYKRLEDENKKAIQQQENEKRKEQFNMFSEQIKNSIHGFKNIGSLDIELDNDEMDEIAQFLLTSDGAGINHFSKVLNDPNWLVRMAWFALKGEEAFNNITDYFTTEIKQREQASYKKGLEDAAKPKNKQTSKLVYQPIQNNNIKQGLSIDDLD